MPSVVAKNATGIALSQGDLSNPLFGLHAHVGDVAQVQLWVDTADRWRLGPYTIPGIAHVAMSLDGVTWGAEGAPLTINATIKDTTPTTFYAKITSVAATAPQLALDQNGIGNAQRVTGQINIVAGSSLIANKRAKFTATQIDIVAGSSLSATLIASSVQNFRATGIVGTTVSLAWSVLAGADHYVVDFSTNGGASWTNLTSTQTTTSMTHSATANTVYKYRIKAQNASNVDITTSYATTNDVGVQVLLLATHDVQNRCQAGVFATARSGGGSLSQTGPDTGATVSAIVQFDGTTYYLDRSYLDFDTTTIPAAATIDESYLRITRTIDNSSWTGFGLSIAKGSWTNIPAAASDFANIGSTDLGGPAGHLTLNTPTDFAIASPNTNVVKNGTARFALIDRQKDFGNSAPTNGQIFGDTVATKNDATANNRPALKVSYRA